MRDVELFQMARGLESPRYVERTELEADARRLDLHLDFRKGGRFRCPECWGGRLSRRRHGGEDVAASRLLPARGRSARSGAEGGVRSLRSEAGGGAVGARSAPTDLTRAVSNSEGDAGRCRVAELTGEHDSRLWRVVHRSYPVDVARGRVSHPLVRRVGVDEMSLRRAHNYLTLTLFVGLDGARCSSQLRAGRPRPSERSERI